MSELCSHENLKKLFDADVLVGYLNGKFRKARFKNKTKCQMLVESAKRAWKSYKEFKLNKNDESFYKFLDDFRKFAYDKYLKLKNTDIACYDLGFVSIMTERPRLGRRIFGVLDSYEINVVEMANLYGQTIMKVDSPFFELEKLY